MKLSKEKLDLIKKHLREKREYHIEKVIPMIGYDLLPIEMYDEHSLDSKDEQDAWSYLESFTPETASEKISYYQGVEEGICEILRILEIDCNY